jgi:hypothetical protein
MPINPQIYVPQIQPMQLQDPMVFARNALAMEEAESSIAANQLKVNQANQLKGLLKNRTKPLTPQELMSAGLFGEAENLAKAENALLTGQKTEGEIIGQEMNLSRRLLEGISALPPAEKAKAYLAWHETQHTNPILQKYFDRIGIKKADADARIQTALQQPGGVDRLIVDSAIGLDKSLEYVYQTMDLGGTKEVIGFPKFGGGRAETVPGSSRVVTPSPNRPVTSITNVQEKAEAGKYGESLVADYTTLKERAESGRRFLPTLEQAQRALDAGLRTGFGAETVRQGARVLAALGEPNAEANAANAELFLAAGKENVLRRQIEQKGTQTASDADRIEQTFISLGTTTTANQFMLDVARAQINRDMEQQRFYQKWRKENGTFDGAEEAWLDGPGDKSLFDRPELKKYATPGKDKPKLPEGFKRDNPAGG